MSRRFLALVALIGAIAVLTSGCTAIIIGGTDRRDADADAGADHRTRDADRSSDHRTGDALADAVWPDAHAGHWSEGHGEAHEGADRSGASHV